MSLSWPAARRTAVERILTEHPVTSNRCELAATKVVAQAGQAEWDAARTYFGPVEGFCIVPRGLELWPPWQMHVAAETERHDVDALTGADGTPCEGYLQQCWKYPENMVRYTEEQWQATRRR